MVAVCYKEEHHRSDMDSQCGWSKGVGPAHTRVCRRCKEAAAVRDVMGYTFYSWDGGQTWIEE